MLAEAARAAEQLAHDEQRPAVAEDLAGLATGQYSPVAAHRETMLIAPTSWIGWQVCYLDRLVRRKRILVLADEQAYVARIATRRHPGTAGRMMTALQTAHAPRLATDAFDELGESFRGELLLPTHEVRHCSQDLERRDRPASGLYRSLHRASPTWSRR